MSLGSLIKTWRHAFTHALKLILRNINQSLATDISLSSALYIVKQTHKFLINLLSTLFSMCGATGNNMLIPCCAAPKHKRWLDCMHGKFAQCSQFTVTTISVEQTDADDCAVMLTIQAPASDSAWIALGAFLLLAIN